MVAFKKFFRNILSAFSVVAMIAIWLMFAPVQAGGMASYIVVIGKSMEPKFHIGDLVIAHQDTSYQVGDAVVYRNGQLVNFVFHRIIAESSERYTLQGDNNSWVDTYQPSKSEILGKLWLHIPRGGLAIRNIRSPFTMAFIAAALGAFLANNLLNKKTRGSKHMNNPSTQDGFASVKQKVWNWLWQINHPESGKSSILHQSGHLEGWFFSVGLILLSSFILGIISFSRPTYRTVQNDIQYEHLGIFSYLAPAPLGVYDSNAIKSGDPIFPRLTCAVDVNLQYTFIATDAKAIKGTYQLTAVVREQASGWQREISLQEETSFTGTAFGTTAELDLCKIEALIQSMEKQTDFHPGSYILSVVPRVQVQGRISGQALVGNFDGGLTFVYDRIHFYLLHDEEVKNPLSITKMETLSNERSEVNTLAFLGAKVPVPTLRWLVLAGFVISLAGFVLLGLQLQTLSNTDQAEFFRAKYDSLIVDVQHTDLFDLDGIDVSSIDALAKVAERFSAVILHTEDHGSHRYYVQAGGTTYRFRLPARITEATIPANEAVSSEGEA